MTYDKETAHKKIREAIAAWVLDPTLPEPEIEQQSLTGWREACGYKHFMRCAGAFEFRLKPHKRKMIRVNGIEVPAPETVAPALGAHYFVPYPSEDRLCVRNRWDDDLLDSQNLVKQIVYLTPEDAIERSKAMMKYEVIA